MLTKTQIAFALGVAMTSGLASATPIELITNGGFETGTFAGWTVTDLAGSDGTWFIDTDGTTPSSGTSTVGPAAGNFYAVTDQGGPGTHALEQSFIVPFGSTSVLISFDMFINDSDTGPIVDPVGLDHNGNPNQHARVDIMTGGAAVFSTAAIDIVANLIAPTVDAGSIPNPYTQYLIDITSFVTPGTTYKLRFGEVDNQLFLNQGVDNVSILAETGQVPEPATLVLLSVGLAGISLSKRRGKA